LSKKINGLIIIAKAQGLLTLLATWRPSRFLFFRLRWHAWGEKISGENQLSMETGENHPK
jgi:hypothetical protein